MFAQQTRVSKNHLKTANQEMCKLFICGTIGL